MLVLCSKTEREINEGNVLLLMMLFVQELTGIRKTQKHTIIEAGMQKSSQKIGQMINIQKFQHSFS